MSSKVLLFSLLQLIISGDFRVCLAALFPGFGSLLLAAIIDQASPVLPSLFCIFFFFLWLVRPSSWSFIFFYHLRPHHRNLAVVTPVSAKRIWAQDSRISPPSGRHCSWSFSLLHSEHHQLFLVCRPRFCLHLEFEEFSKLLVTSAVPRCQQSSFPLFCTLTAAPSLPLLPPPFLLMSWSRCSCCVLLLAPLETIEEGRDARQSLVSLSAPILSSSSPSPLQLSSSAGSEEFIVGAAFYLPLPVSLVNC